jgi:hypothetical protein
VSPEPDRPPRPAKPKPVKPWQRVEPGRYRSSDERFTLASPTRTHSSDGTRLGTRRPSRPGCSPGTWSRPLPASRTLGRPTSSRPSRRCSPGRRRALGFPAGSWSSVTVQADARGDCESPRRISARGSFPRTPGRDRVRPPDHWSPRHDAWSAGSHVPGPAPQRCPCRAARRTVQRRRATNGPPGGPCPGGPQAADMPGGHAEATPGGHCDAPWDRRDGCPIRVLLAGRSSRLEHRQVDVDVGGLTLDRADT